MPTVRPITDVQRNMAAITEECQTTKQPIYLTKNGSAALVVMDAAAFDAEMSRHNAVLEQEERTYRAIMRGLEDEAAGRVRPLAQARQEARALRERIHG